MRRIPTLLAAIVSAVALPSAAEAAVIPTVSGGTLSVTGDGAADQITVRAPSATTLQVNDFTFDRGAITNIEIRSGGGDDIVRIADPLTDKVTIESGTGADTVIGGAGKETIAGGEDADFVQPGGGDDTVLLGGGDDTALQGEGSDTVDGQAGKDTLRAIGTDESEEFTLQAVGAGARISLDTRPSTTDSSAVEVLDVTAGGGPDLVDVGDLGSGILSVVADLGFSDGARDQISVQGSDGFNNINLRPFFETVRVEGLFPTISIENSRATDDRLSVFGRGDVDFIDADRTIGDKIALTLDGGPGQDGLDGSDADDTLRGGPDDDVITGGKGNDVADLGDGDDRYSRTVADGHDRIEGGNGFDHLSASGTESDDSIDVQGLLARTRLLYGFTGSTDMGSVEYISANPFGGTDNVTVRDLSGTPTTKVDLRLNTADQRSDNVTVTGTREDDTIRAITSGTTHTVSGLPATVNVIDPEQGQKVAIDARDGEDIVDATGIAAGGKLQPTLKGGAGADTIVGSSSDDVIAGGTEFDVAFMGGGLDTFTWGPGEGSDIIEGQGGTDFLQMNGSGGNDRFDVLPVGSRTRVTRDIENVNLDLGGLERVDILPGPGGDIMRAGDLSGTATDHVDFNLSVARSQTGGDNTIDRVFIDGTFGTDTINVHGAGPVVHTTGLAAITNVGGTDPELDRLHVDTKPGPDALTVTGTTNQLIGFTSS